MARSPRPLDGEVRPTRTGRRRRRIRRRLGIGLMVASLALAVAGTIGAPGVGAQEPEQVTLDVESTALYAAPLVDVIPNTLTSTFPPAVVCVLFPEACPDGAKPVFDAVGGGIGTVDQEFPSAPVQPVPPDSVVASILGGHKRYQSAIKFALPEVPAGNQVDVFTVTFAQEDPSYHLTSPAFRQAVLAAVAGAGAQDPAPFQEEFSKILEDQERYPPLEMGSIELEACPLLSPFEPSPAPRSLSDDDIPSREVDEQRVPDIDCLVGANGQFDETTNTWSFDLRFALEDWTSGALENHGLLIRSRSAPNLAFGDADTSTNAQATLGAATVSASLATSPPPPEAPTLGGGDLGGGGSLDSGSPIGGELGGFPTDSGAPLDQGTVTPDVAAPEAAPPQAAPPQAAPAAAATDLYPWWLWLLIPIFGAGMWFTSRALTAEAVPATARDGAMTRLIAARYAAAHTASSNPPAL